MEVIVGTAGHIDHGKTALVKALTGVDGDRLPEEKRRGITVDLGFAEISVRDVHFGFVDVPGHERFVKNMLAGACGIDIVILVVAAGEGVMPQTREHYDICRLLGIRTGVVALTKTDMVDAETLELARLEIGDLVANSFLEQAPIIGVSSQTGEGVEQLKDELCRLALELPQRNDRRVARLPIDRSFSVKGFGAVVTGTLASGEIVEGSELELFPTGRRVKVRGIQTHGRAAKSVRAGNRVAVNLGGIDHSEFARGMLLAECGSLRPTQIADVEIEVLPDAAKPIRTRQRVRLHVGTAEELARIQILNEQNEIAPGEKGFAQIRLERPVVVVPGERFIIRSYSPQMTIAGGRVIDPLAAKHRRNEFEAVGQTLTGLRDAGENDAETVSLFVAAQGRTGLDLAGLKARTGLRNKVIVSAIDDAIATRSITSANGHYLATDVFAALERSAGKAVEDFHRRQPLSKGLSRKTLRDTVFAFLPEAVFQSVISSLADGGKIVAENDTIRTASYRAEFTAEDVALQAKILAIFRAAGLEVARLEDVLAEAVAGTNFSPQSARKFVQRFLDTGELIKVTDEFYFSRGLIDALTVTVRKYADAAPGRFIDVAGFKDLAGVSRKYAIPLLEYFDRTKITQRSGEKRIVLK